MGESDFDETEVQCMKENGVRFYPVVQATTFEDVTKIYQVICPDNIPFEGGFRYFSCTTDVIHRLD